MSIEDLTIRTVQPGVTGIRTVQSGGNSYRNLTFQGLDYTLRLDQGIDHTIDGIRSRRGAATRLERSSWSRPGAGTYIQYISLDNYKTLYQSRIAPMILRRATNVTASRVEMHAPLTDGIILEDDCQGVSFLNCSLVATTNGIVMRAKDGNKPSFIELSSFFVDQHSALGVAVLAAIDVAILGGAFSNGWQGILIGAYPDVERVDIRTRVARQQFNGIVVAPGARFFSVSTRVLVDAAMLGW